VAGHLKGKVMQVNCKNMSIDKALRLLRKKVEADGLMQELKAREYYEKPSKKRNRLKQAAIRRNKKK
jgi:small subunit ribosomal protein S21